MDLPKLSWYILDTHTSDYTLINQESFLGSFLSTDVFSFTVRIWNNRWGIDACQNIEDGQLLIQFLNIEDASLLSYLNVSIDNIKSQQIVVKDTKAYINFNKILSGAANNGTDTYIDNYIDITISINQKLAVKTDLKSMVLDVVYYY